MFALPVGEGVDVDGSSDERPLRLEGYLAEDFRQFLRVLVPLCVLFLTIVMCLRPISTQRLVRQHRLPSLTGNQWISVLKLATAWSFRDIRKTAITQLATYAQDDPILRFIVSKQYKIRKWLVPAVNALAQRPKRLDSVDFRRLQVLGDTDTVVDLMLKIGGVRECFTGVERERVSNRYGTGVQRSTYTDTSPEARTDFDFTTKVASVFGCNKEGRVEIWEEPDDVEPGQAYEAIIRYETDSDADST
jgi:hypothetical protein